jgi:hypothetical protein
LYVDEVLFAAVSGSEGLAAFLSELHAALASPQTGSLRSATTTPTEPDVVAPPTAASVGPSNRAVARAGVAAVHIFSSLAIDVAAPAIVANEDTPDTSAAASHEKQGQGQQQQHTQSKAMVAARTALALVRATPSLTAVTLHGGCRAAAEAAADTQVAQLWASDVAHALQANRDLRAMRL